MPPRTTPLAGRQTPTPAPTTSGEAAARRRGPTPAPAPPPRAAGRGGGTRAAPDAASRARHPGTHARRVVTQRRPGKNSARFLRSSRLLRTTPPTAPGSGGVLRPRLCAGPTPRPRPRTQVRAAKAETQSGPPPRAPSPRPASRASAPGPAPRRASPDVRPHTAPPTSPVRRPPGAHTGPQPWAGYGGAPIFPRPLGTSLQP
jgi:hypothetical protein